MNIITLLTQVPQVDLPMLQADFWLKQQADEVLLSPEKIPAFNEQVYQKLGITPVLSLPDTLPASEVYQHIDQIHYPTQPRYSGDGQPLTETLWESWQQLAHPRLEDPVKVKFGLVVRRGNLRALPTHDILMDEPHDHKTDYLQESTLDVGCPVAVLCHSTDKRWAYVLSPHYWGWFPLDLIAIGTREEVTSYTHATNTIFPLTSQGLVALENGGGVTPQASTRFPLLTETDTHYTVQVPTLSGSKNGHKLKWGTGIVAKNPLPMSAFHYGDLPPTPRSLLEVGFEMLGERYAWGGSRLGIWGRDCSQFAKDVYATIGVKLPRNADQQERVLKPRIFFTDNMRDEERKIAIAEFGLVGDLLFTPTHVMLYLGHLHDEPYVLHTTGRQFQAVIVSTLEPEGYPHETSLLRRLTSLRGL